jgi:prolyl oligopeptidase
MFASRFLLGVEHDSKSQFAVICLADVNAARKIYPWPFFEKVIPMKSFTLIVSASLALVLGGTIVHAQSLTYPVTSKVNQVDDYHGNLVADPYRWLEDDNSNSTKSWVEAQSLTTERYMATIPQRSAIRKIFTKVGRIGKIGLPLYEANRYFWTSNDGTKQQSVLYASEAPKGKPTVILDPNKLAKDGTVAITEFVPSRDGRLLAYGLSDGGSDWETWHVRDLKTGMDLLDEIKWVKFSRAAWTPDSKGFFYARYDAPKEGHVLSDINEFQKLYYHRVGTLQSSDVVVAENKAEKDWSFDAKVSDDGKLLLVQVSTSAAGNNGLMVIPLEAGAYAAGKPLAITLDFDAEYQVITAVDGKLFVRTNKDAPRGRVIVIDLASPSSANWKTVVPEGQDALESASGVGGQLVLSYLNDVAAKVLIYSVDGKLVREVSLPGIGMVEGFAGRWSDTETTFRYNSITVPHEIHRLNVRSGKTSLFMEPKASFNRNEYETHRHFVTSKDGTRFPIFIAHRKGIKLDGTNPTLLYGYGGFNSYNPPMFSTMAAAWISMGGVYVVASTRGGSEYGSSWHEAAVKEKKQNVFDDFIASAEWIVSNKYTKPARLAIFGLSNGGLLVGAVVNQRPELFAAAVPMVGVMDMLRFQHFTVGSTWVDEYGSSANPVEFKALAAYSPLHNVRSGVNYPAILVTTGDHDDRVVPAHSFKYVATLQAAETGSAPKLIRVETKAGHGSERALSKHIGERTDILAFMARALKMKVH